MKKSHVSAVVAAAVAAFAAFAGCKSDDDHDHTHESAFPACDAIIEACHPVDVGQGGMVTDCHTLAHEATSEATCTPKKDACVAACQAAAADGGSSDAGAATDAHAHDQ